jgi:HAE1 family hydrophobic/amphiphilic exporter-1
MAILLESVILPLSTLLSIPLALMGVMFGLYAFGFTMGPMVVVGMIILAGIVVNNAIVLLDRVQRLRSMGLDRHNALLRGGRERLRPILMTALTTIFGLMPMAMPTLFPGGETESGYESMAVTVAGGLAFSTFFTLLIVPLFYTFFDDIGGLFKSFLPSKTRTGGAGSSTSAPTGAVMDREPS